MRGDREEVELQALVERYVERRKQEEAGASLRPTDISEDEWTALEAARSQAHLLVHVNDPWHACELMWTSARDFYAAREDAER